MLSRILIIFLFSFSTYSSLWSQQLDHRLGEILVRLGQDTSPSQFCEEWQLFEKHPTHLKISKQVSKALNIWHLKYDCTSIHEQRLLESIRQSHSVINAQFNHFINYRQTTPNDPFFNSQWQYINTGSTGGTPDADIDADLAWDITTGGLTADGDEIVVAILDDGVDLSHTDFGNNLWVNNNEIPNNNQDDDNNGYVDDYEGWNISSNSDNINGGQHGAPVAGIIGAKGNNNVGVTGVNWNVKMMIIKNNGSDLDEANVISAYSYPLEMRQLYNDTDGEQGAFVVVTNASWGIDQGQPAESPLWCDFYNSLGEVGIISCGATANENYNVDNVGDLPTACSSDYLISVTNLNHNDIKITNAGYGSVSIDLGAHGSGTYTIKDNNSYGEFSGTSGACPHVAGAVALLYSLPCPSLIEAAKNDPAATALSIKSYILDGVDPNASLQNITVSEGRLNLYNSLILAIEECNACPPPFSIVVDNTATNQATLSWIIAPDSDQQNLRYKLLSSTTWNDITDVESTYTLNNLEACTQYEFQLESICAGVSSGFSESHYLQTDGCCDPPSGIDVSQLTIDGFYIDWLPVSIADHYNLLITDLNTGTELLISEISPTDLYISGLEACTNYSVQLQTFCSSGVLTDFTDAIYISTLGCGACTDFVYCSSQGEVSDFEWIENVSFNSLLNSSYSDNGYGDYTGSFTEVSTYGEYPISLTPGYYSPLFQYDEYFRVWIDYNQDGEFDPISELAFDAGIGTQVTINSNITIPGTALPGLTRMRVSMKFVDAINDTDPPEACQLEFDFGEVEDYCVNIVPGNIPACVPPESLDTVITEYYSAELIWTDQPSLHDDHNIRFRQLGTFDWTSYEEVVSPFILNDLSECVIYEAQVQANCINGGSSSYTSSFFFKTDCINFVDNPIDPLSNVIINPSPFSESFTVTFHLAEANDLSIELISIDGRVIPLYDEQNMQVNEYSLEFTELNQLSAGLYFIKIITPNSQNVSKLIKVK